MSYAVANEGDRTYLIVSTVVCEEVGLAITEHNGVSVIYISPCNTDKQKIAIVNQIIGKNASSIDKKWHLQFGAKKKKQIMRG